MLMNDNVELVSIPDGTPLHKRGVVSVGVKPLNWKKERRANDIVDADQKRRQKEVMAEVDDAMMDKVAQMVKDREKDEAKKPTRGEIVDEYRPAFPYLVYAGLRTLDGKSVGDPPEGMLDNGESAKDGWLENECSVAETKQLAGIVLDVSGMVESGETEGNGSGASTQPSA